MAKQLKQLPPNFHVVEEGLHDEYQYFIAEGPLSRRNPSHDYKQYNGYVALPENHPIYKEAKELEWDRPKVRTLDVHGGITYVENGIIGFDTAHAGDYAPWLGPSGIYAEGRRWPIEAVRDEIFYLISQLTIIEENGVTDD